MATISAPAALALTHLNLDIRNLEVSEQFYQDRLGLAVERRPTSLRVCTAEYLLVLNAGEPAMGGTFHFGFRVPTREDVDAWAARLRASDVSLLIEPHESGPVYVLRFADPDAYEIEIYAELE